MILRQLSHTPAYRVHNPRWAHAPTSGAGAASNGGRLNRPGMPVLYLALDEPTALAEYRQLSPLLPPGLIVSYEIALACVMDASGGVADDWDTVWQELDCDWRRLWFHERVEPPSWLLGNMAIDAGASGILYLSTANPGGTNLALFTEALDPDDTLRAYDPDGRLPRDSRSWDS